MSRLQNNELIKDIFAYGALFARLGFEECISTQTMFVEMLNEAGFKTSSGKNFSKQSFRQMISRLDSRVKKGLKEEIGDALELLNIHGRSEAITESIFI